MCKNIMPDLQKIGNSPAGKLKILLFCSAKLNMYIEKINQEKWPMYSKTLKFH